MEKDTSPRITPEKQLLKLIETSDTRGISHAKEAYRKKSFLSPVVFKNLISYVAGRGRGFTKGAKEISIDIQHANWILKIFILISIIYFITITTAHMRDSKNGRIFTDNELVKSINAPGAATFEARTSIKPLSYYIGKAHSRDIFSPFKPKKDETPEGEAPPPNPTALKSKITEFSGNLKLVGISWSNNPDAIVENVKIGRTFFLKKGDSFLGAVVEAIFPEKVIIKYEGEEIELR